ncbi:MAG: hypothetical protein QM626_07910 [Microbacterium sp.]|uniref:hypothetical protein n=1 Tax=Microbacterium sp. TaxID=51671 RepID=UPI0039E3379E
MTEYKYVSLPSSGRQMRSNDTEEHASIELNTVYVAQGWDVVNATRPALQGQIGFLLRRG